jgi:hypothetical protein
LTYSIDPNSYYVVTTSASSTIINGPPYTFGNLIVYKTGAVMGSGGDIDIYGNLILENGSATSALKGANSGHNNGTVTTIHVHHNALVISGQLTGMDAPTAGEVAIWNIDGNVTVGDTTTPSTWAKAVLAPLSGADGGLARTGVFNIGGNLTFSHGATIEGGTSTSSTGTTEIGEINLKGNLSLDASVATGTNTKGQFAINFVGTGTQTVTLGKPISFSSATMAMTLNDTVASGAIVVFNGGYSWASSSTGATNGDGQWIVNGGLTFGANDSLKGIQAFVLNGGATFTTANANGLATNGSIQVTGPRTYMFNVNYEYNGSAAQVTGAELTSTVHNLAINNANGVTLTNGVTVSGTATIASGAFVVETSGKYLIGTTTTTQAVGTSASTIGGIGVSLNAGADNLGNVTVTRVAGTAGIVTNPSDGSKKGIARNWTISSTNPPTSGRNLTLSWDPADDNGKTATELQSMEAWKSTDGGTSWFAVGPVQDASSTHAVTVSTTTFSKWTVSDVPDNPLPVEMTSFTAAASASDGTTLHWSMASELNNSGWDVQRATVDANGNVSAFTKIGYVKGSTNSVEATTYSFVDRTALYGTFEYRLNQIDVNGNSKFTNPIKVSQLELPKTVELGAYPNPFNPTATLRYALPEAGSVVISVYNSIGQLVTTLVNKDMDAGIFEVSFNASSLPSGMYFARLGFAGKASNTVKITKMLLVK